MYYALIFLAFAAFFYFAYREHSASAVEHEGKPDSVGPAKLTATLLATAVGGGLIFGLIGFGGVAGTIGLLLALVYLLAFIALGLLAPSIRRACRTMVPDTLDGERPNRGVPDVLAYKYNRYAWGVVVLAYSVVYIAFLAAQYISGFLL